MNNKKESKSSTIIGIIVLMVFAAVIIKGAIPVIKQLGTAAYNNAGEIVIGIIITIVAFILYAIQEDF